MLTLSGFADEISPDLDLQLDVLGRLGLRYLELRGIWNTNVLDLDAGQVRVVKDGLARYGIRISAIGSPIGKIQITDPFEPHLDAMRRALDLAEALRAPYIRLFSFFVPEGQAELWRGPVLERLGALLDVAKGRPVTLLHENERHIYGDVPQRCLDLIETLASPQLRVTFDPANFVQCGVRPFNEAYPLLHEYIAYLHIKDALATDGRVVPAGQGDGQLRPWLQALETSGFSGFASLEPHLQEAGQFRGFSGPALFETAAQALRGLMHDIGIAEG